MWTDKIFYVDEKEKDNSTIRCLVYGKQGSGKTTFAATFPEPFFIDTDFGLKTIKDKHFQAITFEKNTFSFSDFNNLLNAIKTNTPPFDTIKTIVIDSLSELTELILFDAMLDPKISKGKKDPLSEKADYDEWAAVKNRIDFIISTLKAIPKNLVVTCGVRMDKDENTGSIIGEPLTAGKYREVVGHRFDEVYYLCTVGAGSAMRYVAKTRMFMFFDAKSRSNFPFEIINPTYALFGGQHDNSKAAN